jgi:hypothetical protein
MPLIVHTSASTLCESKDFMEKELAIDLRMPDTIPSNPTRTIFYQAFVLRPSVYLMGR